MATIIEDLQQEIKKLKSMLNSSENDGYDSSVDELRDAQDRILELENENEELQDNTLPLDECDECVTPLGTIYYNNVSGNLALQQEIETFMEQIKKKYP